ncbi:MAG: hypothetical protein IPH38_09065 [Candidatus Microthrix sp.]|nr:hypothetical protein [Candidatus Microthrix sp.]MBK7019724.1 hypothetical protein [Candidatus Microthrix sp.]
MGRSVEVEVNSKRFAVKMFIPESELVRRWQGRACHVRLPPEAARSSGGTGSRGSAHAGHHRRVLVEVGQRSPRNRHRVRVEAMKMENNIAAGVDGTAWRVKVEPRLGVQTVTSSSSSPRPSSQTHPASPGFNLEC